MASRWYWLAAPALAVAAVAAGCGGGDNERTFRGPDGGEVSVSDDLPDEWPDDFPVYPDADLQGSYFGESGGVDGLVASWTTGDSLDEVGDWYEGELADGEWTSTSDGNLGSSRFFSATNGDESQIAYVSIAAGDGDTAIVVAIGDDPSGGDGTDDGDTEDPTPDDVSDGDGSGDGNGNDSGSADLPDEVGLDGDFPTDLVALPDEVRVTSSSSISSGGTTTHFVEFYSEMSADDLESHFSNEMSGDGWEEAFRTSADGETVLTYSRGADEGDILSGDSATVLITEADVDGYRVVSITVTVTE